MKGVNKAACLTLIGLSFSTIAAPPNSIAFEPNTTIISGYKQNIKNLNTLRSFLNTAKDQSDWHLTIIGYVPDGCNQNQCEQADLLRRRAETLMQSINSKNSTRKSIVWNGLSSMPLDSVQISMHSKPTESSRCGKALLQDASFPVQVRLNKSRLQSKWNSSLPFSATSTLTLENVGDKEVVLIKPDGELKHLSGDKPIQLQESEIPASLQIQARKSDSRIGPVVQGWDGQAVTSLQTSALGECTLRLEPWMKGEK